MSTIVAILRAAHCKSVHHFFAIDALCEVLTPKGKLLADLLLANYQRYLQGAKDPDNVFKDFENHVVHVSDGYWGGAGKTAAKWLAISLKQLNESKWSDAAYSLGVLSHYVTDPFMPLHTGQSAREATFHRPLEWSVCCAYQELYDSACTSDTVSTFDLPSGEHWMMDTVHLGARLAHQYYDDLMNDYDMGESRRYPARALGAKSKRILAQLFTWSITAWASILEEVANNIQPDIPEMALTLPTLLASSQIPKAKLAKALELNQQRNEIERMAEEFHRTGQVTKNLPIEQRIVKKIRSEHPELKPSAREIDRAEQIAAPKPKATPTTDCFRASEPVIANQSDRPSIRTEMTSVAQPLQPTNHRHDMAHEPQEPHQRKRLQLNSPIVDAPAIGPKTAARFIDIGVNTVKEFLQISPAELADRLQTNWISAKIVAQWQAQARLALSVDRLSAAGAGLLVMIGIESVDALAEFDANTLHAKIVSICSTKEAKRLLRDKGPPPVSVVHRWIASATKASRVASD